MKLKLRSRDTLSWLTDPSVDHSFIFRCMSVPLGCVSIQMPVVRGNVVNFDWSCQNYTFANEDGHLVIEYTLSDLDEFDESEFFHEQVDMDIKFLRRHIKSLGLELQVVHMDSNLNYYNMLQLIRDYYLTPEHVTASKMDGFYINYNFECHPDDGDVEEKELSQEEAQALEIEKPSFKVLEASWSVGDKTLSFPRSELDVFSSSIKNNNFYLRDKDEHIPGANLAY